jgi:glycosyltransferase involved in cell wall biosynthesis
MSVSVIIPAYNEGKWLPRTIQNILDTAKGRIQIIVVDYGGNGPDGEVYQTTDKHVKSIVLKNQGERVAMNAAARAAKCSHLLRIDAHCDFSPEGWDVMMEEVTDHGHMTQAMLTAVDKEWNRLPGHHYERCRLHANMEAKWEKPNGDISKQTVVPNMSSTGCGFMMTKDFYWQIGGANEAYPKMGAIGEEFSVKTWLNGGKVQTRTDVIIGHIFDTGGYDTGGVLKARECLVRDFGDRYDEIYQKFPDLDWGADMRPTAVLKDICVDRTDTLETKDDAGVVVRIKHEYFKYYWVRSEHPEEANWTEEQVREKYAPLGMKVGEEILVRNMDGDMVEFTRTPVPAEHYELEKVDG